MRAILRAITAVAMECRFFLARNYRKAELSWMDYGHNRHCSNEDGKILIIRHHLGSPRIFDVVLSWVERHVPEIRGRFELRGLPFSRSDLSDYSLCVMWLPDPVQRWSERAYRQALDLTDRCRQQGVPIVNDVQKLLNATKCLGSKLIGETGIRTPVTKRIEDVANFRRDLAGMEFPILLREDYGHCRPLYRAETMEELSRVPLEELATPLVAEFIDVQSEDRLYRKYRYFAVGDIGIPHHLQVKDHWITKGSGQVVNDSTCAEEVDYLSRQDRHHEQFQRARAALGIDMLAFDYGYTPAGEMVVWEANPYPLIHYPGSPDRQYRSRAVDRTIAAIIKYYHQRAGLEYPAALDRFLEFDEALSPHSSVK